MEYRKLGNSNLDVSVITMGCWTIAGGQMWGPQDEKRAINTLRTAVENGINFFDSAEGYGAGRSEELIGKAFADIREDVIIASKVSQGNLRPKDLRQACENSLRNLGMDTIDVYYLHWPNWDVPYADTLGEMARLKEEGKIRHIGCSNFGKRDLTDILEVGRVEIDQLPYSLLFRAIEFEVVPTCRQHNVSIACYSPLMHGILADKYASLAEVPDGRARTRHFSSTTRPHTRHGEPGAEAETAAALDRIREICDEAGLPMAQLALAWLLKQPSVATVIAGASNPEQIKTNAAVAEIKLADDVLAALDAATAPLKQKLGANADMWENASKSRIR